MVEKESMFNRETRLANYDGKDKVIKASELKEYLEKQPKPRAFQTGLNMLDKELNDIQAGEIIVISGPTCNGKTTLARAFTTCFSRKGIQSLWFSFEDSPSHFFSKFPDNELPDFCLPQELISRKFDWIEDKIIEAKIKYNIDIVFIDHLHYIVDFKDIATNNSSLYIGAVMRNLKMLANKHNIAIFLIAHMAKTAEGKEPSKNDIRDSSFIQQEADAILIIWRNIKVNENTNVFEYATNQSKLKIDKARRTGNFRTIYLNYENNQFSEDYTHDKSGNWQQSSWENS